MTTADSNPLDKAIQSTVERFNQMVTDTTPERGQQAEALGLLQAYAEHYAPNQPQEHTATPWIVEQHPTSKAWMIYDPTDKGIEPIAWLETKFGEDAAFIVRCVNSHEALVDLARKAQHGAPGMVLAQLADVALKLAGE